MIGNILAGAAVVVGLAAAYFAWRTIPPKRELTISMRATPLLNRSDSDVDQQLRVVHDELGDRTNPQVVVLSIRNSGRAAVASAHYDANQPLPLDLGRPILQLIQAASKRRSGLNVPPPPSRVENGILEVGPGLMPRKQHLTFTVLVDGEPNLEVAPNLVDVEVKVIEPDVDVDRSTERFLGVSCLMAAAAAGASTFLQLGSPSEPRLSVAFTSIVLTFLLGWAWSFRRSRG